MFIKTINNVTSAKMLQENADLWLKLNSVSQSTLTEWEYMPEYILKIPQYAID